MRVARFIHLPSWFAGLIVTGLVVGAGCGPSSSASDDDDNRRPGSNASSGAGGSGPSGSGGGTTEPGGPVLGDVSVSATTLTPEESLTFVVEVTDPDGGADIEGGELKDDAGAVYAPFLKNGGGNTYALTLDWYAVDTVSSISFASGEGASRAFVVEFVDKAGHVATSNVTVDLRCYLDWGYCNNECVDTDASADHCGACNNACLCNNGSCEGCSALAAPTTCETLCAAAGDTCSERTCGIAGYLHTGGSCSGSEEGLVYGCDEPLAPTTYGSVECCCI
jgi:hypothetical protein